MNRNRAQDRVQGLTPGRHGRALDAERAGLEIARREEYGRPPFTVELRVRLRAKGNLLIEFPAHWSREHWQIMTDPQTGVPFVLMYRHDPFMLRGRTPIADDRWHDLAMTFDGRHMNLFVDGRDDTGTGGVDAKPNRDPIAPTNEPLWVGTPASPGYSETCHGLIEEVRISKGIRPIERIAPAPLEADEHTIGLWRLDLADDTGAVPDLSVLKNDGHIRVLPPVWLDDVDRESFRPGPAPFDGPAETIELKPGAVEQPNRAQARFLHVGRPLAADAARPPLAADAVRPPLAADAARPPVGRPLAADSGCDAEAWNVIAERPQTLILDGLWEMAEGGGESERLTPAPWPDAIPAAVPGSVHMALERAGKIPDPKFGRNDAIAHDKSFSTWWFRCAFLRPEGMSGERLCFDGVANRCTVWLNGERLGAHDGMFGGPSFEIAGRLRDRNTLVVKVDPVPGRKEDWSNNGWRETVTFNNSYGWHYSSIAPLGIWRSVRIESAPAVRLVAPFVVTRDALRGEISLIADLEGPPGGWSGELRGAIAPENFSGSVTRFTHAVSSPSAGRRLHLRLAIPDPRPWWPNGIGAPNLYRMVLSFVPDSAPHGVAAHVPMRRASADAHTAGEDTRRYSEGGPLTFTFGLRTVAMAPIPGQEPNAKTYQWTFVINGRPTFVNGTGWCTMDSSMDFSRERYDRFLSLARDQHCQMLRAWGAGMPETDDFYDLCDRYGLMVMQEWPTAWSSHALQPYDAMEETVRLNTLRLRNHPSLVMWGAGNETQAPYGPSIDMMGRYAVELDGTRPFHRAEPYGGSEHNYDVWWGQQHIERTLELTADFYGEFGVACLPVLESVRRYLPDAERDAWPPPEGGSFLHHLPLFGKGGDWDRLKTCAGYFTAGATMERFVVASQLAQVTGVRHVLERARTRWPRCTGALMYKLNDNYPAASWSTVDWYGAPKIGHFFVQNAFAPLHACAILPTFDCAGKALVLPVFLLDDADALRDRAWEVCVRAFDQRLREVGRQTWGGRGPIERGRQVGEFGVSAAQTATHPLLTVVDLRVDGTPAGRTFYWQNFEAVKDCLFTLPRATLRVDVAGGRVTVANTGKLPAVGVEVSRPGHAHGFTVSDNYLWLDPGETRGMAANATEGLAVGAWNAE